MLNNDEARPAGEKEVKQKIKLRENATWRKYLFIYGFLAYPLLNFIVFYILINFNGILLAFQETDTLTFQSHWAGLTQFKRFFEEFFKSKDLLVYTLRSAMIWGITLVVGMPLNILFAYLFLIKIRGTYIFRALIMVPMMISGLMTSMIFMKLAENVLPELLKSWFDISTVSLLRDERYNLPTLIVYTLLTGFSYNVILYSNAMGGSSESMFEAVRLDGATHLQTIWYLCVPLCYPIMTTFIVTSVPSILCGDIGLYVFYQYEAPKSVITTGYYLFILSYGSSSIANVDYSYSAAVSLIFTLVSFPLLLAVRWFMEKHDPTND